MSDWDELVGLKLRQARRKEFPVTLIKFLVVTGICVFGFFCLVSLLQGCGARTIPAQSQVERKKAADDIWGGHTEARRKRLP